MRRSRLLPAQAGVVAIHAEMKPVYLLASAGIIFTLINTWNRTFLASVGDAEIRCSMPDAPALPGVGEQFSYEDFVLPREVDLRSNPTGVNLRKLYKYYPAEDGPAGHHRMVGFGEVHWNGSLAERPFRSSLLHHLFQSFHEWSLGTGFLYWLGHGSLLGQLWGGRVMPWDLDLDVQTTLAGLHAAVPHNRTLFQGRFWLDVNPFYVLRTSLNSRRGKAAEPDVIDARWVDTWTGVYIDITAVALVPPASAPDRAQLRMREGLRPDAGPITAATLRDKSVHTYRYGDLFPLTACAFAGLRSRCPASPERVLDCEYTPRWRDPHYEEWYFNSTTGAWGQVGCRQLMSMYVYPTPQTCAEPFCREIVSRNRTVITGVKKKKFCLVTILFESRPTFRTRMLTGLLENATEFVVATPHKPIKAPGVVLSAQ